MRALMCPPTYVTVTWEDPKKNAWQKKANQPVKAIALKQWADLVAFYWKLGIEIYFLEPQMSLGDMCFTANAAWGRDNIFVLANFEPKERRKETPFHARWLVDHRFSVYFLPENLFFEGQGDIVTLKEAYIYGYGVRNTLEALYHIEDIFRLKRQIVAVRLIDPRFYHLDLALHYLKGANAILYCPAAFDDSDLRKIEKLKAKKIELYPEEIIQDLGDGSYNFLLNAVYLEKTEIFPWRVSYSEFPKKIKQFLEKKGIEVVALDFSEFGRLGGAARCLTLFLD